MTLTLAQRIHDALAEIDAALIAMHGLKDELTRRTTDLIRVKRELRELDDELTPVRPPSLHDMRQALSNAQGFKGRKP